VKFAAASRADLDALVALLGALFAQEKDFSPNPANQARALKLILSKKKIGTIYVARDRGRVVGMVSVLDTISTAEGGRAGLLEDLVVAPGARGRGIGRALLRHAIAASRKRGLLRLTLLTDGGNRRAQRLYARAGFRLSAMRPMRRKLAAARRRSSRG
jgi:ribosomal protein S18 acetylase RimI-like enzyme